MSNFVNYDWREEYIDFINSPIPQDPCMFWTCLSMFYRIMESKGKIGIVGSGLIGKSWAMIFASVGYNVVLYDVEEKQVTAAIESIAR